MTDGRRVTELLEDRPDFEDALEDVHEVDEAHETWTFDDVPIDSGTFGQLVSEGVVEKIDGEYRLANPDAVQAVLSGESAPSEPTPTDGTEFSLEVPTVDWRGVGLLVAALLFVVAVRLLPFGSVFRDGAIVLSGNDPYFYLYWVEQTLADGTIGALPIGEVPEGISHGEPFLVAWLAWLSGFVGGNSTLALALYPVLSALLTALMLYVIAMRVTRDRRVALSTLALYAVIPAHAFRTSLGFADHHAFDYIWLTLTALALVVLLTGERDLTAPTRWLAGLGLAVGIAGQVLAWENGLLLVVPVAGVVVFAVLADARAQRSPLLANAPLLLGLGLAAVAIYAVHDSTSWYATAVAVAPALLVAGSLAVVAVGELAFRLGRDVRELAAFEIVTGVASLVAFTEFFPDLWSDLQRGIDRLFEAREIAEVQPLFSGDSLGFLLLIGVIFVVAIPMLGWATVRLVRADDEWLVPAVYGWYFLALAMVQVRFVGQLSAFTALFAGLGFVWLASWVDLTTVPGPVDGTDWRDWWPGRPERSTVVSVFVLFLLVGGLSVVQSGVKMQQVTIEDDTYETASFLAEYADDRGWENQSESYVFSDWGRNRVYNYFVNGDSQSYGFAQSNYRDFIAESNVTNATRTVSGRARFVVTESFDVESPAMGVRLHDHYGSRYDNVSGLSRYRAIYATESGDRKAFLVVPGATMTGTAAANTTVSLSTDVSIPNDEFTYDQQVKTNPDGSFSVGVAYPGTYELSTEEETWSVEVSEAAVMNGTTVDGSV
jgi:dolichyl-diphosphooligosaccharide--protein glycosyltransferase